MSTGKTSIVIQARMGSKRLPGKSMMKLGDTTVIGYLLRSIVLFGFKKSQVVVATSNLPENVVLANYIRSLGFGCFQGSEDDVLSRYQMVAREIDSDTIVRLTGDNPFLDLNIVQCCMNYHFESGSPFTSTRVIHPDKSITRYVPKGSSVDIFQKELLLGINADECDDFDREHVIPQLYRDCKVNIVDKNDLISCGIDVANVNELSIDTYDEYKEACRIVLTNENTR